MASIANYSAALHYLKAVADMGVAASKVSGIDVVNRMKAMPLDDDAFGPGRFREDGRKLCPSYLFEVKTPGREQGPVGLLQAGADHPGRAKPSAR